MQLARLLLVFLFLTNIAKTNEINLFTSRHYESDIDLYKKFTTDTGIKVNIINGKSKVLEKRILDEGSKSKADILFLADAGALFSAQEKTLFTKHNFKKIETLVPKSLRNQYWVGIVTM